MADEDRKRILLDLERRESDFTRLQRQRMTSDDFEPLTIIGRGAFGEVRDYQAVAWCAHQCVCCPVPLNV